MKIDTTLPHRLMRYLVLHGDEIGPPGKMARWYSRSFGWMLKCGYRVVLDRPDEFMQRQMLICDVFEESLVNVLRRALQPGDLVYDVGANMGHHSLVAASFGCSINAFEPVPRLAERLYRNVVINALERQITVYRKAVGAKIGVLPMYVAARGDDGSHSLIQGVEAPEIQTVMVEVTTLDHHWATHGRMSPALIKMDVEGFEACALDGAAEILTQPDPPIIILETGDRLAAQINESARTVLDRLAARHFRIFELRSPGRLVETTPATVPGDLLNYVAIHADSPRLTRVLGVET